MLFLCCCARVAGGTIEQKLVAPQIQAAKQAESVLECISNVWLFTSLASKLASNFGVMHLTFGLVRKPPRAATRHAATLRLESIL